MTKPRRPPPDAHRKNRFRETARNILRTDRVKRQFGEAVDTAGALARAMEQAYRLGFEDALVDPSSRKRQAAADAAGETGDAMRWELIPPRTRNTFWSICLAALGRTGRTDTPSQLVPVTTSRGTLAWHLVVPDRQTYEKTIGDGTVVTLVRLGLLQHAPAEEPYVTLTNYGIRTWNRFCERGDRWPGRRWDKDPCRTLSLDRLYRFGYTPCMKKPDPKPAALWVLHWMICVTFHRAHGAKPGFN